MRACVCECARVRVRAPMRKYTNFQKAGLLNNYYTPVLNRIERASVKEGQEGLLTHSLKLNIFHRLNWSADRAPMTHLILLDYFRTDDERGKARVI